jgi:glucosamine--fructose-6-phosphate aminotransferase (isomerizing)
MNNYDGKLNLSAPQGRPPRMTAQSTCPFVADILSQPRVLRAALAELGPPRLQACAQLIRAYDRVVLTGMGGSYAALIPTWRSLLGSCKAVWLIDTAELLSLAEVMLTDKTLVIAVSQSGRSAELVSLAERFRSSARFLAVTNDPASALARASHAILEIHAGEEHAVSTRTYLNTLAVLHLLVQASHGEYNITHWQKTADAIEAYLQDWRDRVEVFKRKLGMPERLMLLARGDSMASAVYAALVVKEAAKCPVEAMGAAQFRHGPLELADSRFAAIVLAGANRFERERNLALAQDIERYGGRAFWLDTQEVADHPHPIEAPGRDANLLAAQTIPLQLLSVALAEQAGLEPGVFRHLQKVTTVE